MRTRTMPKNGDELSILGYGCMRLPSIDGKIDTPRATKQLRSAIDRGVNYVDTAWPYHGGQSEPFLAHALKDGYREKVRLATKLPTWMVESRDDMDRFLDAQLKKLETDHIDYYLMHTLAGPSWDRLVPLGITDFMDKALADGRIMNAGFSFHGMGSDFNRIVDGYDWTFCQIQYNYLDRENQAGLAGLEYAASKNLGVIVMEPLRGGNLSVTPPPEAIGNIWSKADTERTPTEWALRWVWDHPEVTLLLSGMNEESHIDENIRIAETADANSLTERERELVDEAAAAYRSLMKTDCTGCGYCMPCPSNVSIPMCFEEYNQLGLFSAPEQTKFRYAFRMSGMMTGTEPGFASQCTACGVCVDKCPQGIPIPEKLEEVVAELEGPDLEKRIETAKTFFRSKPE